jgi:membrane protein
VSAAGARRSRGLARSLWSEWTRNKSMDAAAALTFYGILALCPFVLFVVAAASAVIRPAQVEALGAALARNAPLALAPILLARLAELTSRPRVGVLTFGALAAVWSSTAGVASLVSALNVAYGVSERRPLWKVYALALATMLGAALLALLASVLAVAAPLVAEHLDVPWRSMVGWLRIPAATFVMMVVWAAVYYRLPNVTQTIPSILPGAVVGVLVWLAATLGFSFYVAHFGNFGVTYGALGALVVLLVWMWLSSLALMLGAEINAVIRKSRR